MENQSITNLLKELNKLRWDRLEHEQIKNEWKNFFRAGNSSAFYINTLNDILTSGLEAHREYNKKIRRGEK
jgi:hypothetical protein